LELERIFGQAPNKAINKYCADGEWEHRRKRGRGRDGTADKKEETMKKRPKMMEEMIMRRKGDRRKTPQ
jgi:hypothetical protein